MPMSQKQRQIKKVLFQYYSNPVVKVSLDAFLSIFLILFFSLFAVKPTLIKISGLIKDIEQKKELVNDLDSKIVTLRGAVDNYERISNQVIYLDEAVPNSPQLLSSLKIIEKVVSDKQIAIKSISVSAIPPEIDANLKNLDRLTNIDLIFNIIISGDFQSSKLFVEDLLKARRTFYVDRVVFSVKEEKGSQSETNELETQLTVKAPYFTNK